MKDICIQDIIYLQSESSYTRLQTAFNGYLSSRTFKTHL